MLSPNFNEGQKLASARWDETILVELPEDDAEALEVVFNVIHYRLDRVPDPLSPDLILRAAIAGDKYDFLMPLKMCCRQWIQPSRFSCEDAEGAAKVWQLAIAAAWLDHEQCFQEATRALLLGYGGSYLSLGEMDRMPSAMVNRFNSSYHIK